MTLFGVVFTVFGLAHVAFTLPSGAGSAGSPPGGMNMGNFNLNTAQGIQGFLNMEGINPTQLVTSNCIGNGNSCAGSSKMCCLSPVFSCQGAAGNSVCRVVPGHVNHIPQIQQIVATIGASTTNPIF